MDQSKLTSLSPERLAQMLEILQESRLRAEAEARNNAEMRRVKEIDLALHRMRFEQRQHGTGTSTQTPPSPTFLPTPSSSYSYPPPATTLHPLGYGGLPEADSVFSAPPAYAPAPPPPPAQTLAWLNEMLGPLPSSTNGVSSPPPAPFPGHELIEPPTSHPRPSTHPSPSLSPMHRYPAAHAILSPPSNSFPSDALPPPVITASPPTGRLVSLAWLADAASSTSRPSPPPLPSPIPLPSPTGPPTSVSASPSPSPAVSPPPIPAAAVTSGDDLPPIHLSRASHRLRARCTLCRTGVCILVLHAMSPPLCIADVRCSACAGSESPRGGARAGRRRRRVRRVDGSTALKCDACGVVVGVGGARVAGEAAWVDPGCGVEAVCDRCVNEFDFCTQCGGGGNFRTGKWRPRQLFDPPRRNCTLPHLRLGHLGPHHTITFRLPPTSAPTSFDPDPVVEHRHDAVMSQLLARTGGRVPRNDELLRARCEEAMGLWRREKVARWAAAGALAGEPWAGVAARVEGGARELAAVLCGEAGGTRRYLCTVDAVRTVRSGRRGGGGAEGAATTEAIMTGFVVATWDVRARAVGFLYGGFVAQGGQGDGDDAGPHAAAAVAAIVGRIEREAAAEGMARPCHVWGVVSRAARGERERWAAAGVVEIDEYCARAGWVNGTETVRRLLEEVVGEGPSGLEVVATAWGDVGRAGARVWAGEVFV
ncbi:hypothetical protein HDU96_009580 [Phlyctochytrium bullatum]|nr:hypothetical protein HDU96_009580 [Phlyctochytrium bullatum]